MRSLLVAVVALFATFCSAIASEGEVVLTLRNGDQTHEFTVEDLRNLGEREVVTETIWSDGEQRFVGVSRKSIPAVSGN